MIEHPGPVIVDCVVEKHENCFPMIPSGKAHNEMLLGEDADLRRDRRRRRGAGLRRRRAMNALAIKKGASRHSAYDLRGPLDRAARRPTRLAVLVDNEAGVLARVIGLFSGRGYNIESLTVAETDHEGHLSRITIVTTGTPAVIEQIKAPARPPGAGARRARPDRRGRRGRSASWR